MTTSKAVLITGCSSGIGQATAVRLVKAGFTVYASARKVDALKACAAAGCKVIALDVNDEQSMVTGVAHIEKELGGPLFALVNNAGYSQSGALATLSIEKVRAQFETNLFGLLRLTQLVLPGMRKAGVGRVINISSMGGTLTFPGGGAYHASKYALEALSDALRIEMAPAGIDVVVIQPGIIRTGFAEAVAQNMPSKTEDAYAPFNAVVTSTTKEAYENGPLAKLGGVPDDVAKVIERALTVRRPKTRYAVTASAHVMMAQRALMTDRVWDAMLRSQMATSLGALPKGGQ